RLSGGERARDARGRRAGHLSFRRAREARRSHARQGGDDLLAVAAAGTIGYFAGSLVGWAVGRYGGRPLLDRHARWFHLNQAKLARSERWFDRWGNLGVLIGRLAPLIRSFVSLAAGIFKIPLLPYSVLTLVGSAIWAFALAGAGWAAGTSYG